MATNDKRRYVFYALGYIFVVDGDRLTGYSELYGQTMTYSIDPSVSDHTIGRYLVPRIAAHI